MLVTPKLRLVRPLGAGGMGAVWLAEHLALHTQVVIKFVSEKLVWSTEAVARFSREAAAASQVKSPHVVQMLDHGVSEHGLPYIVMELLEGHDLADHLTGGGLPPREVVAIVTQLCRALARAHEVGVVHRDIKPSNVFLCQVGGGELFVKLLDFGVAKLKDSTASSGAETQSGALLGSPVYMSPEQLMGDKRVDYRSDLWSVGVLTFEALTGVRPFGGETVGALTMQVHAVDRPRPTQKNPMLPASIDTWFARACAVDPAARFAGAKELSDGLAHALGELAPRGIELDGSRPRGEAAALADTAQVSSGGGSGEYGGSSASGAVGSSRSRLAQSQPSAVTGTGSGIATSEPSKPPAPAKGSWRTMALVGVAALAVGLVGPRMFGGSGPPAAASVSAATATATPAPAAIDPPAVDAATTAATPAPSVTEAVVAAPPVTAPKTVAPKAPKPRAAPSASASARPAASTVRAQGSDDDIR
jgi:serine/threonine-protein kinase